MPNYNYSFMMEWGSWICGLGMILLAAFCLVAGLILFKKLFPHSGNGLDKENNTNNL